MPSPEDFALIVFEDGFVAHGNAWGAHGQAIGEAVFDTGMTGYQKTITDPAHAGQIVIQTAPHIGITGITDDESTDVVIAGYVVRDPARYVSNWRATGRLDDLLRDNNIVGICNVDTRALTLHVRDAGPLKAGIFSGDALPRGAARGDDTAINTLVSIVNGQQHSEMEH